jgi:hypothetical protein
MVTIMLPPLFYLDRDYAKQPTTDLTKSLKDRSPLVVSPMLGVLPMGQPEL